MTEQHTITLQVRVWGGATEEDAEDGIHMETLEQLRSALTAARLDAAIEKQENTNA